MELALSSGIQDRARAPGDFVTLQRRTTVSRTLEVGSLFCLLRESKQRGDVLQVMSCTICLRETVAPLDCVQGKRVIINAAMCDHNFTES